jgi:hypothetical protein
MNVKFNCVSVTKNPAPQGQQPTYNFTWQVDAEDEGNRALFGGTPIGTLTISGSRDLPIGWDQSVTVDLGGTGQPAPAAQQAPRGAADPRAADTFRRLTIS